jgi:hypothetical protein
MGDRVEVMLRKVMAAMMINDHALVDQVSRMDNTVDRLYEAIKLYVTKLTRGSLDEREGRRAMEVISFSINLEHIDKNLSELATACAKADPRPSRPPRCISTSCATSGESTPISVRWLIPCSTPLAKLLVHRNAEDDLVALPVPATHSSPR